VSTGAINDTGTFTTLSQRSLYQSSRSQLTRVFQTLRDYPREVAGWVLAPASAATGVLAVKDVPGTSEAANLARRFRKHGASYIRFITTPGIEPTNNLAEQAIRFVVIDRLVTQGCSGGRDLATRCAPACRYCIQRT
jgi:hypothetical protein